MPATRRRVGIPRIALILALTLVGVGLILTLGQVEGKDTSTSASNYQPSGLSAFAEVLRRTGYHVEVTRSVSPSVSSRDLLVIASADAGGNSQAELESSIDERLLKVVQRHARFGGPQLWLSLSVSPESSAFTDLTANLPGQPRPTWKLRLRGPTKIASARWQRDHRSLLDLSDGETLAVAVPRKSGMSVIADGQIAQNRAIQRADHAVVMDLLVRSLIPTKGRIVILDAASGNGVDPGLLASLSPAAPWVVGQLLVFFVVVVVSQGRRFGLPDPDWRYQRATRELLDAFADVMHRARRSDLACRLVYRHLDAEVRRAANVAASATVRERDVRISPDLSQRLADLEHASRVPLEPKNAARVVDAAWRSVAAEFPSHRRRTLRRR